MKGWGTEGTDPCPAEGRWVHLLPRLSRRRDVPVRHGRTIPAMAGPVGLQLVLRPDEVFDRAKAEVAVILANESHVIVDLAIPVPLLARASQLIARTAQRLSAASNASRSPKSIP